MVRVDADLTDAVHAHIAQQEVRSRVQGTARLEHRELEREPRRQRRGIDRRVDVKGRDRPHTAEHFADDHVEPVAEGVDVLRLDRETRGHRVTPMFRQQVAAPGQRLGDVHARDAAAGALALVTVERDDAGRPAVILHQPRRGEPDDAGLPRRIGDDGRPRVGIGGRRLPGAAHDIVREPLPLEVALLELVGEGLRFLGFLGEQEPQRVGRIGDPAGRVQSRAEAEPDVRRADPPELQPGAIREGAHAGDRRAIERGQTRGDDGSVLSAERHHVSHGRERAELQELVLLHRVREIAEQRLREPQRDARAGELLVVGDVTGPARVHQGVRLRKDGRRVMVVGDDQVDAELLRELRLGDRGDAAVHGDHDLRAVGRELAQRGRVEAVALLVAVRDVRADRNAKVPERAHEDGRAGDAVDVVVPVDDDALAGGERTADPLDGTTLVEHRRAVVRELRREVRGHVDIGQAAGAQDLDDEARDTIGRIAIRRADRPGDDPATLRNEGHDL